eukprot:1245079-Prymnesium_polylepis.1
MTVLAACCAGVMCSAGCAGCVGYAGWAAGRRCALAAVCGLAKTPWVHFGPPKSGIVRPSPRSMLVWYQKDAKRMRNGSGEARFETLLGDELMIFLFIYPISILHAYMPRIHHASIACDIR